MNPPKMAHPYVCTFVPPHVLEFMAKSSSEVVRESVRESARLSMMQDDQIRATRAAQAPDVSTLSSTRQGVMAPPAGTAGREVFNCGPNGASLPPTCSCAARATRSPRMMM